MFLVFETQSYDITGDITLSLCHLLSQYMYVLIKVVNIVFRVTEGYAHR